MEIKDSGTRYEFPTGAVRDIQEGKGRPTLMPLGVIAHLLDEKTDGDDIFRLLAGFCDTGDTFFLYAALTDFSLVAFGNVETMLLEVSKHFEAGAVKYGENNWQKGIPTNCYLDSAIRHYLKYRRHDQDEPHDRAFCWNIICCIWEEDYHERAQD